MSIVVQCILGLRGRWHWCKVWYPVVCALGVIGCANKPVQDPAFAAVSPLPPPLQAPEDGAIYLAEHELTLFDDVRARRVGDLLTVRLVERTDASKSAETTTNKESTTDIENPTLFGSSPEFNLPGWFPLESTRDNTLEFNLESDKEFEGGGESSQSNSLTGDISVTVVRVFPNGNLFIQGEKLLTLNQGNEHVRFSGIVRQSDITAANTVLSTQVADARIVYAGNGALADANSMGWLSRFFQSPYFPF